MGRSTCVQAELPIDPSSLTRWRRRIGEEGVETLLALTMEAAHKVGTIGKTSIGRVIVDTTVAPKALAIPPTAGCSSAPASIWSKWPRAAASP